MKNQFWFTPTEPTRYFETEGDAVDFASRDVQRLVGGVQARVFRKSSYGDTIEGGILENVSEQVRSVVQEQAMPATSMVRPGFGPMLGAGGACGKVGGVDQVGFTEFLYQPLNYRGRGPKICIKTTRTGFAEEYPRAVEELKRNMVLLTNADIRANYLDNGGCKLACNSADDFATCFLGDINAVQQPWPNVIPDSPLSFTGLSYTGRFLRETLDVEPFENPESDNGMLKYIGSADSIELFRDELNIRADIGYLTTGQYKMGQKTIQGYTWEGPYRGHAFGIDPHPLRASGFVQQTVVYNNATVTEQVPVFVEPWIIKQVSSGGFAARPNPLWIKAPYEVGFLFGMRSFKRLVPASYRVEGWEFAPQIANGGLEFRQLIDLETKTLGDYGQHFYEIERAFQPTRPHSVVAIVYARCKGVLDFVPCTTLEGYGS